MSRFKELLQETTPESTLETGFNPNAVDGDGDGQVQDGTKFQRPSTGKGKKKKFSLD